MLALTSSLHGLSWATCCRLEACGHTSSDENEKAIMKPRQCWSIMAGKAERRLALIQADALRAGKLLEKLEGSQRRLQVLYEEYRLQGAGAGQLSHGMQDALNHRQFMSQLATLSERVAQDIEKARWALAGLQQQMAVAEIEKLKMKTLDAQEVLALEVLASKREQRSMDEVGLTLFNRVSLS